MYASASKAYQRRLNVRLVLPQSVKDVLRSPADEPRLERFRTVLRQVIQGADTFFIQCKDEANAIANAVENGPLNKHGVELGEGSKIPAGAQIICDDIKRKDSARVRIIVSLRGSGVHKLDVLTRPKHSTKRPALVDDFGRALLGDDSMDDVAKAFGLSTAAAFDRMLLCLY